MEHTLITQQLMTILKEFNLSDCGFDAKDELNKTYPSDSSKFVAATPSSAVNYSTEMKKKRRQMARITPFTPKNSFKARKSLQF